MQVRNLVNDLRGSGQSGWSLLFRLPEIPSLPFQVTACLSAALFHVPNGISLSYSAVLIGQLEKPGSEIPVTNSDSAWIGKKYFTLFKCIDSFYLDYIVFSLSMFL